MRNPVAAIRIVCHFLLVATLSDGGHYHQVHATGGGSDCPFSQIFSYLTLNLCIVVTSSDHDEVRLGYDCTAICPPTPENGYRMRLEGTQLCLQASHGGGQQQLLDGNKMRVKPCDADEELQQFVWTDDSDPHPLQVQSFNYDHLCATNRGVNAQYGDPIIFKECNDLHPEERQFWWGD